MRVIAVILRLPEICTTGPDVTCPSLNRSIAQSHIVRHIVRADVLVFMRAHVFFLSQRIIIIRRRKTNIHIQYVVSHRTRKHINNLWQTHVWYRSTTCVVLCSFRVYVITVSISHLMHVRLRTQSSTHVVLSSCALLAMRLRRKIDTHTLHYAVQILTHRTTYSFTRLLFRSLRITQTKLRRMRLSRVRPSEVKCFVLKVPRRLRPPGQRIEVPVETPKMIIWPMCSGISYVMSNSCDTYYECILVSKLKYHSMRKCAGFDT